MRNRILIFLSLLFVLPGIFAQDTESTDQEELIVDGKYTGGNLYVLNPSAGDGFSVQHVTLNGKEYPFTHNSNAFEISLADCTPNDYVIIQISYLKGTEPKVVNAECIVKESEFSLPSFIYNKKTKLLAWNPEEMDKTCSYRLEQLLYGKWITVKDLGTPDDMIADTYLPVLLTGMNLFRIKQVDASKKELSSPVVKLKSPNRKVYLVADKVKDFIEFTAVTHYELYDANGFFIKRGTAQKVNISDLKKGNYWINFDGKEAFITKK